MIKVLGEVDVSYYVNLFSDIDDADWMDEFSKFSKKYIPFFRELYRLPLLLNMRKDYEDNYESIEEIITASDVGNNHDVIKFLNEGDLNDDITIKGKFYGKYYNKKFFDELFEVVRNEFGDGQCMTIIFNLMNPHSRIHPHADERTGNKKRIHIPIITHPDIKFRNGSDEIHMEVGKVYKIEHSIEHSVDNPTDCERIHLVIDWKIDD